MQQRQWVVRGGVATAGQLIAGYGEHLAVSGLFGFSVQYAPGLSVDEIARARRFPHTRLSIAYDTELSAAVTPLGYALRIVHSPGRGYHHTLAVLYDATGVALRTLPPDAARALAAAFRQIVNPYPGRS